jgi:DnaJ family protein A protein 5
VSGTPQIDEEDYEFIDEDPFEVADEDGVADGLDDHNEADQVDEEVRVAAKDDSDAESEPKAVADDEQPQKSATQSQETSDQSDEDSDYASPEAVRKRLEETSLKSPDAGMSEDENKPAKPKMGKAALKRAKKAAATAASTEQDDGQKCASCDQSFPSRTKLFKHIEDPSNRCKPALKTDTAGNGKGKKGKGKR